MRVVQFPFLIALLLIAEAEHALNAVPGRTFIKGLRVKKRLIVFKVQRFDYAAEESCAGEDLKLSVEVSRVLIWSVKDDGVALYRTQCGIVNLQINLHSRSCLKDIGLTRHVDGRQHRYQQDDAHHQPYVLAYGAPVFAKPCVTAAARLKRVFAHVSIVLPERRLHERLAGVAVSMNERGGFCWSGRFFHHITPLSN